ncbi:hypothetical protein BJ973_004580 [Actinoplanes tereljensis]|uniref:Allene oxide cyclase barrel-like domain-containing protein n=1 Tax=Paractinoplanes tereljensis TaxID=571912 RepID=A0A919NTZ8_9ACTN|nr:hypothetical protein [Actinoplanes tereljensis]GIF23966.1 hypothetical protein Ate02nite_66960 [Actinoplanes tereljensis]
MTKRLASILVALVALSLVAVAWPVARPTPAAAQGGSAVTLGVHFSGFFLLDFSATGVRQVTSFQDPFDPSRGDQTVFRDELLRNGQVVGHDDGSCTVTDIVPTDPDPLKLACQVTFSLPEGQITTQGAATNNPVKRLAITGGTGRYTGAYGEAVLTESGDETGSLLLNLTRR